MVGVMTTNQPPSKIWRGCPSDRVTEGIELLGACLKVLEALDVGLARLSARPKGGQ